MAGTADTLRHLWESIHAGAKEYVFFLDGITRDILPQGLTPHQGAIWIRLEAFDDAVVKTLRKNKENKGKKKERKQEEAVAEEGNEENEEKESNPGYSGKGEEEHGREYPEDAEHNDAFQAFFRKEEEIETAKNDHGVEVETVDVGMAEGAEDTEE